MRVKLLLIPLFVLWSLHFTSSSSGIDQASFYGNSFIAIPLQESRPTNTLSFKFRTNLESTLIFLIAGYHDYCKVDLEEGRIRVVVNLGAGEAEVLSAPSPLLNDFKWHEVNIIRREDNLAVYVDRGKKVQTRVPGKNNNYELNIHYGLFVGDYRNKNNSDLFFGHIKAFRGCLSGMKYNDIMVLEEAKNRQLRSTVEGVTWNCAAEFEASTDQPISFVEDDAFLKMPHKTRYKDLFLKFDFKTSAKDGLLFYNPGIVKFDFFIIEILNKTLRSIVKINEKFLKISISDTIVSDGNWHTLTFQLTPTTISFTVNIKGGVKFMKNLHAGLYQLADSSYIGGLENSKRFRATQKGCGKSCDNSFKGCIKNVVIFGEKKGLPDAQVSLGLLPGCVWEFPCTQNPCKPGAKCVQKGLDSFQCTCKEGLCVKDNYTEPYKVFSRTNNLATDLELLAVEPLKVLEGDSQIITSENLHMILDYQKYGIKDSGITFFILSGPDHGVINVDIWPNKQSFTLLQIANDKVHYIHDGSEELRDNVILAVEFSSASTFVLPMYLQGHFRFNLVINIISKNDVPVFDQALTKTLRVVEGSSLIITPDLFKAIDPDNPDSDLYYTIVNCDIGHFENQDKPDAKIISFTQEDVNQRKISFVHNSSEPKDSYISLEVSDGIEVSPVYKVRVSVTPQVWRVNKNTGLTLLYKATAIITPFNLSFTSNVPNPEYKLIYKVIRLPNFGILEVEKGTGRWEPTDIFSSLDIQQHRVRYRHEKETPPYDEFQYRPIMDKTAQYRFRIIFVECHLYQVNSKPVELEGVIQGPITTKSLSFETRPLKPLTSITYHILSFPEYGYLFSSVSKYRIKQSDNFTQQDIFNENIHYSLHRMAYSDITDEIFLGIQSEGCVNSTTNLIVKYYPKNEDKFQVKVNIQPLTVEEGSIGAIDRAHLNIRADFVNELMYNITSPPKHGFIQITNNTNATQNNQNFANVTDVFSADAIYAKQIYYRHDGSETEHDRFKFMVLSSSDDSFEYVGIFDINITLINDNTPTRVIDKSFKVVVGGEKLLTGKDLKYTDKDIGTLPSSIIYSLREVPNGSFYNVSDRSKALTEFSQADLDNNFIIFKHKGPERAKLTLWVTDGTHHTNGLLEIEATGPFIHVLMEKKMVVEVGKVINIKNENLCYTTNLYATDREVLYDIISGPSYGKIVNSKSLKTIKSFTQEDINLSRVSYLNDISSGSAEEIGLKVRCKDAVNIAQLGILILPSIYWQPLILKNLKRVIVEESTSAVIANNNLEISQANVPPSHITYYIVKRPQYGYITILPDSQNGSAVINVASFTQDIINQNRLLYIQAGLNQSADSMSFNVSNGIMWLRDIALPVGIIPNKWYLGTHDVTVNEGGTTTITEGHIFVATGYYKGKSVVYTIIREPVVGCVQIYEQCAKSKSFTTKDLGSGIVKYSHDGSETSQDLFSIIGEIEGNKSEIATVEVKVYPVNDNVPRLVNNTGLIMWAGGMSLITNTMLGAIDDDRPKDTLKYHVQSCWWGNVALRSASNVSLNYFTQEMVNRGMVVFNHKNGSQARFVFNISDGVHRTKDYIFEIHTKPVVLNLTNNRIHIFPLQKQNITNKDLKTICSDGRLVTYSIVKQPTLGRIMMQTKKKGYGKMVSSFTQDDIDNNLIYYEHLHPFLELYANDSFVFNVEAYLTEPIKNETFRIDISVSSGGLNNYVSVPKVTVDEGETTNIPLNLSQVVAYLEMHSGLHKPNIDAFVENPKHGRIFLQNDKAKDTGVKTFSQKQLEQGQVFYEHDNSDTLSDNVTFSFFLSGTYVILCNVSVPIIVNPVNDQPFKLLTPAPKLVIVQGENHTLTRDDLCTEDADTLPENIKYDLMNGPSAGRLLLFPDLITASHFTQDDINEKRVIYIHDGIILKDSFHIRIWDEKFKPEFTVFTIIIQPLFVHIRAGLPIQITQGKNVGDITEKTIFAETNANIYKINYKLVKPPKHGLLFKNRNYTEGFNQRELASDSLMYLQTDPSATSDSFKLYGGVVVANMTFGQEIVINVEVKPLLNTKIFRCNVGEMNKITLDVLDASALARLTDINPTYTLKSVPRHCKIRKVIKSTGEKKIVLDTIVRSFTHEEVISGLIYLDLRDINDTNLPEDGLHGKITFTIMVENFFQPAIGELEFVVKKSIKKSVLSTMPAPHQPAGHEGDASSLAISDYIVVVTIIIIVGVTAGAIFAIVKCTKIHMERRREQQRQDHIANNKDDNILLQPLPRPPGGLPSATPSPLKSHYDITFTPPVPAALPQCKVTPLTRGEFETPSPHVGYPYSDEMIINDDWSSVDNASDHTSRNIMLRRNQYWV